MFHGDRLRGLVTKLIHAYFDVHVERLWYTVVDDLPGLEQALRAILIEMD